MLCVLFLSQLADFLLVGEAGACQASTIDTLITRLERFGQFIPQEKVYLHMDNTCYFLGDTIWFAAYTRQTNNGRPSNISRILYVELYNQDGYMMERQLIEMKDGRGHGNFVLSPSYFYGGYYELRAYTRWQLNWGRFEHKHSRVVKDWFVNKEKEAQYYRDYDKLYSRVFPVYDEPEKPGVFDRNMTLRPLRRYFRKDMNKRSLQLMFYPEGGQLVESLPCRMAFEASYSDGEWLEGVLHLGPDSAVTVHRGRGTIIHTPSAKMPQRVSFTTTRGEEVTAQLPKAEKSGVALQMKQEDDTWDIHIDATTDMPIDDMAVTVMHEGVLQKRYLLQGQHTSLSIPATELPAGVNQLTVFDSDGRVWADRLFFVRNANPPTTELAVQGIKEEYEPFELVAIDVQTPRQTAGAHLSMAVRDRDNQEYLYDSGNIMTEMLLASEIKGFVPQPEWYFEADDKLHREGLDLLMMTQGWRRFNWQDMAVSGRWEIEQPAEKYQILRGRVTKAVEKEDTETGDFTLDSADSNESGRSEGESEDTQPEATPGGDAKLRYNSRRQALKREVLVHAELVSLENYDMASCEGTTSDNGHFSLVIPRFTGKCIFFLSASDSTKWHKGRKYEWVRIRTTEADRFEKLRYNWKFRDKDPTPLHITLDFPYPRFVSPYHYYQNRLAPEPVWEQRQDGFKDGVMLMKEVSVKARRNGLHRFSDANPAFSIDAYDGYNFAYDAGVAVSIDFHEQVAMNVARAYIGDMGLDYPYYNYYDDYNDISQNGPRLVPDKGGIRIRYGPTALRRTIGDMTENEDSLYMRENLSSVPVDGTSMSDLERERTYAFDKTDKYVIYTDYMPRLEGDDRYYGSNLPETNIVIYPFADGSLRATYRDRRLILPGFSVPDEFYHPDYSQRPLPDAKDYRRTLYWNPDLQLDANGHATVSFYNNSQQTQIAVSAEGMDKDGKLLTGNIK